MKIAIVGDCHVTERNPRIRRDNYLETVLNKLDYIANDGNDKVIILGDLFHTYNNSEFVLYKMYDLLNKHRGKFISIIGNHDVFHRSYNTLSTKTTIGYLYNSRVIDLKTEEFQIDGLYFNVALTDTAPSSIKRDEDNNKILLGHKYFDSPFCESESLTRDDIENLNYNLVFLGHDHKPYEEEYIGNSTLIRMGSLTRMDSQYYNRDRKIVYYQLDTKTNGYIAKIVPTMDVSECCIEGAFDTKVEENNTKEISFVDIEKAISKMCNRNNGNISLDKVLKELKISNDMIDLIKEMYQLADVEYM